MAEAAGASLGAVRRIDYTWNEVRFTSERTYSAPEMSEGHSAMPDIELNSISGSEEVRVQWELVQWGLEDKEPSGFCFFDIGYDRKEVTHS